MVASRRPATKKPGRAGLEKIILPANGNQLAIAFTRDARREILRVAFLAETVLAMVSSFFFPGPRGGVGASQGS